MELPFPLQTGENMVLLARRHWIYLWPRAGRDVVLAVVPVVALIWLLNVAGHFTGTPRNVALLVSLVWLLGWTLRLFLLYYRYQHDIWVVTDRRLVDVLKERPWRFRMSSADLVDIEDTTVNIDGVLATVLGYGSLDCQTAGEQNHFTFAGVPRPRQIGAIVDREVLEAKGRLRPSPPFVAPVPPPAGPLPTG